MNFNGIVYLVTNTKNNKKYIGITTEKDGFNGRYKSGKGKGIKKLFTHLDYHKNYGEYYNQHLYRSIEKYGCDNFTVNERFDTASNLKELYEKERYWIAYFKSNHTNNGYNITNGGEGGEGWSKNKESLLKFRTAKAKTMNKRIDYWYKERLKWDNKFYLIWEYKDRLDKYRKDVLFYMLLGGKVKKCECCGVLIKKYGSKQCYNCSNIFYDSNYLDKNKTPKARKRKKYKKKNSVKGIVHKHNKINKDFFKTDKYINYNAVLNENKEVIKIFKYKFETREWINKNGICETNNFSSSQLNALLKNGKSYKGYIFKLIDENTYNKYINAKEALNE